MSQPDPAAPPTQPRQFPCKKCGASLVFAPGTQDLKCQYCGELNHIEAPQTSPDAPAATVVEHDYEAELQRLENTTEVVEQLTVKCQGCGAESQLAPGQTAGACMFCGKAMVAQGQTKRLIKPQYLLPFGIPQTAAITRYRAWLSGLWFAPSDLKTFADRGGLKGIYTPAWTYDCETDTDYTGQRGEHYWTTETYTTIENGRAVMRTRQVQRTRWYPASGNVDDSFDDVLVMASRSLPDGCREKLKPWDLPALVVYQDEFLAGFVAESYQIDLRQGFEAAKNLMQPTIQQHICGDIGGDEQRIDWSSTKYEQITYKHILLPLWLSSYRYHDKVYRFLVNARTGEVWGERPYSAWKIAALVAAILLAILIIVLIASSR